MDVTPGLSRQCVARLQPSVEAALTPGVQLAADRRGRRLVVTATRRDAPVERRNCLRFRATTTDRRCRSLLCQLCRTFVLSHSVLWTDRVLYFSDRLVQGPIAQVGVRLQIPPLQRQ